MFSDGRGKVSRDPVNLQCRQAYKKFLSCLLKEVWFSYHSTRVNCTRRRHWTVRPVRTTYKQSMLYDRSQCFKSHLNSMKTTLHGFMRSRQGVVGGEELVTAAVTMIHYNVCREGSRTMCGSVHTTLWRTNDNGLTCREGSRTMCGSVHTTLWRAKDNGLTCGRCHDNSSD